MGAIAASIGPRGVWLEALYELSDHVSGCGRCWPMRVPRCDEGHRLLAEEQTAYQSLADVREAGLEVAP